MKLTTKQQLDTHDKLIAKLMDETFQVSKVVDDNKLGLNSLVDFFGMLNMRIDGIREMVIAERKARKQAVKRLWFVIVLHSLSLLAILYLLWIKLP